MQGAPASGKTAFRSGAGLRYDASMQRDRSDSRRGPPLEAGTWYAAEELFSLCDPVLVSRPGDRPRFTATDLPFLNAARIEALNALAIDGVEVPWSSREIRARIAAGATREEMERWVPAAVAEEIIARGLYREASA